DRTDHVEAPCVEVLGQAHRLAGTFDVRDPLALCVRSHVVDRRQVEEMVHIPAKLIDPVGAAEPLLGEVADHRNDAAILVAPAASELLQTPAGPLADEHVDRPLTLEQPLDQVAADETGAPGDEVTHLHPSTISTCGTS